MVMNSLHVLATRLGAAAATERTIRLHTEYTAWIAAALRKSEEAGRCAWDPSLDSATRVSIMSAACTSPHIDPSDMNRALVSGILSDVRGLRDVKKDDTCRLEPHVVYRFQGSTDRGADLAWFFPVTMPRDSEGMALVVVMAQVRTTKPRDRNHVAPEGGLIKVAEAAHRHVVKGKFLSCAGPIHRASMCRIAACCH